MVYLMIILLNVIAVINNVSEKLLLNSKYIINLIAVIIKILNGKFSPFRHFKFIIKFTLLVKYYENYITVINFYYKIKKKNNKKNSHFSEI